MYHTSTQRRPVPHLEAAGTLSPNMILKYTTIRFSIEYLCPPDIGVARCSLVSFGVDRPELGDDGSESTALFTHNLKSLVLVLVRLRAQNLVFDPYCPLPQVAQLRTEGMFRSGFDL